MYLEEIIGEVRLENNKFECKSILDRNDIVGWLKTISGFANADGGDFYIGVEDKTNKLIGFDRKDADSERNYFNNQVNELLTPRPKMIISFIPYMVRGSERFVMKVSVFESGVMKAIEEEKTNVSDFTRNMKLLHSSTLYH